MHRLWPRPGVGQPVVMLMEARQDLFDNVNQSVYFAVLIPFFSVFFSENQTYHCPYLLAGIESGE